MPGVWNQQEFLSMIRSAYQMWNPLEPCKEKSVLMKISFLSPVCSPPLFIFLQHTALWYCPTSKMTTPSVHMTQFFNTFFFHAMRNAFWKKDEYEGRKKVLTALLCGSNLCLLPNATDQIPLGGSPTLELTEEVVGSICSTLSHLFMKE